MKEQTFTLAKAGTYIFEIAIHKGRIDEYRVYDGKIWQWFSGSGAFYSALYLFLSLTGRDEYSPNGRIEDQR